MQPTIDRDPRVRFKHPVRVVPIGGPPRAYRVLSSNLSREGMFLRMPTPFDTGTRVALSLEAGGRVLPFAQAEVVWRDLEELKQPGRGAGFGVRFTGFLHPRAHELVDYLVANLETGKPLSAPVAATCWSKRLGWVLAGLGALVLGAAVTFGLLQTVRGAPEVGAAEAAIEPLGAAAAETGPEPIAAPQVVEATPEAVTAPVVEANPEPAAAPVVETKPEPVAARKVETKPEPVAAPVIEAKPQPAAARKVETKPEPVAVRKVETKPEPVAARKVETKPEPVAARKVETKPDPVGARKVETRPQPAAAPPAEAKRGPIAAAQAEPGTAQLLTIPSGAVKSISASIEANQLALSLSLAPGAEVTRAFVLHHPDRLAIDVSGAAPRKSHLVSGKGEIRKVRVGKLPRGTRVVVDLARPPGRPVVVSGSSVSVPLR